MGGYSGSAGGQAASRCGAGDGGAGVEFLELPEQPGLALFGRFAPGVEVRAEVLVGLAALEDLVGDLEQGVCDCGDRLLLRARVLVPAEPADQPVVPGLEPAP